MFSNTARMLLSSALVLGVMSGCSVAQSGPGTDPAATPTVGEAPATTGADEQAETVDPADDDPLNVGANGAKLCAKQPPSGSSVFTVLVHNATDQVFTLGDVELGSPQQLALDTAQAAPANREGHHSSGDTNMDMDMDMDMDMSEAAEPVEPVSAAGYEIKTHEYINVLVEVSLDENASSGTAAYVELNYSSEGRDYTVEHPLEIELTRDGCS